MTFFELLDTGIGIIFLYLLLSLICTALMEIIEAWLKKRSTDLERGIREMLGERDDDELDLVNKLYKHPLIFGLYRGELTDARRNGQLPSYIGARTFALALMDVVLPATDKPSGAAGAVASPVKAQPAPQVVVLSGTNPTPQPLPHSRSLILNH